MCKPTPNQNKALVIEAFDTLFNKQDYDAAARFWSDKYVQHSAHIEAGREGLFNLVRSLPDSLRYEHGLILAEGDYVIVHGRFSGNGRPRRSLRPISSESKSGVLLSIGTCFRTRQPRLRQRAGYRCSEAGFPRNCYWSI
jgi:hypothetical protein